jgi:polar amino acid transport system substrate-binding protein
VGVSVDLAAELARRIGASLELVVFDGAAKSVDAVTNEQADIGFFAIDPLRGAGVQFTDAYVLLEGCYAVAQASPFQTAAEVAQAPGVRIAVGRGSAYDLFLTRELPQALLTRAEGAAGALAAFYGQPKPPPLDVLAGIRKQAQDAVDADPGLRLLQGHFMLIRQAMGCPKGKGPAAAQALAGFVEEMKASGFVAQALQRHGVQGVAVAPAA